NDIMPHVDAYVTNGGYGGVLLSIENNLPMVVAGVHEGKNEINARIGYFKYGVNLKTENPQAAQIRLAANEVINNKLYRYNVEKLSAEFSRYNPEVLFDKYVNGLLKSSIIKKVIAER